MPDLNRFGRTARDDGGHLASRLPLAPREHRGSLATLMGSLIKKRRKRMRKKKHKKMLKRTRFQRRAKK